MPTSLRAIFENKGGMNTLTAPDLIPEGEYAYLQNVRRLLGGRLTARPPMGGNLIGMPLGSSVTSVARLNDPYAASPGYVYIEGSNGGLYVNTTEVASGLSGNPISFLPYRPPSSPQPWMYCADPSMAVGINTPSYAAYGTVAGMVKVRSDGTCYKTGIKEPQVAPGVSSPGGGPNAIVYRYTYRASKLGAVSNPSPESTPVQSGASNAVAEAGVSNFNPTQYTNYSGGASGGVMNNQWSSQYGSFNQFETINNGGSGGLLTPIQTQNMNGTPFGAAPYPVPTGVTITGIQFQLNWLNETSQASGTLVNCQLAYQGGLIGSQKTPGVSSSSTDPGGSFGLGTLVGGNGDSWGAALSPAIVNDPTFGVNFQILQGNGTSSGNKLFINVVYVVVYWQVADSTLTPTASADPQVDTIDWYRMGGALLNFTYVGSSPNSGAPSFTDTISDTAAALNPVLQFDNFEPFPSIDLPRSGIVNSNGSGGIQYVSGDHFNMRWLPGTIVLIAGVAYVLYNRPASPTGMTVYTSTVSGDTITFGYPPAGLNLTYQIAAPELANEPSPVIWGPTPENAGSFYFGLDPNNPGDLLWSMGNNFDSAPDTNRLSVTSPSESLMNGTVTSELSTVFSTERFWLIYPNFADAVAAVTGTLGQQWTLVQAESTRGLYMRYAIAALASKIVWRAKDGIFLSAGGGPEQEISRSIYNLFPHGEARAPAPVTIGENTVWPPDDTQPNAQTMAFIPGYVFYDYKDTQGNLRTLVYDIEAKGWSVDATTPAANCHALPVEANQILLGCGDGTVRVFDNAGGEIQNAIVATSAQNGGSPRTIKRLGGVFLRALAAGSIIQQFWANRYSDEILGFIQPGIGPGALAEEDYLTDFTPASGTDVLDLSAVMEFPLVPVGTWLKEWQVDWTSIPEQIVAWRTGMLSYGMQGWLQAAWLRFAYSSSVPVNLTINTDQGASFTVAVPSSNGQPAKFFAWLPAVSAGTSMKFKLMEWTADASGSPITVYGKDCELAIKSWGSMTAYQIVKIIRPEDGSTT